MVTLNVPVLYGNAQGGYDLTERNWDGRIPAQVSLVNGSGAWLFLAVEMHEEIGTGLPQGGHKYFLAQLKASDADWALAEGDGGNHCYYRPSKVALVKRYSKTYQASRSFSDFTFRELTTNFQFHALLTHLRADDPNGKSRTPERKAEAKELAAYANKVGFGFIAGDFNSSTERSGYPRDILENAGWRGLRQRGSVVNGSQSSNSTDPKKDYWIDEIWTRPAQPLTGSALVKTNGASDHNGWLKTTIGWDVAGAPTPPKTPTLPATAALAPALVSGQANRPWTASVRQPDLTLDAPVSFTSATLVENYNAPDMLSLTGRTERLRALLSPRMGILLHDEQGNQRFSGTVTSIRRRGNGTCDLIFAGDLVRMWWRVCYPTPLAANGWTTAAQTSAYDVQTGPAETRLLAYIARNLGGLAIEDRKFAPLRQPASQGRGPSATSSLRFDVLGSAVAALAESANLRVQVRQVYVGSTPYQDVTLTEVPDLGDWASFGTPESGGPWMLSDDWVYGMDLPVTTTALSAAGGTGATRILTEKTDQDAESMWGRIETVVDQRDTTDATEINTGLTDALATGAGPTEIAIPLGRAPGLGTLIPVGARVAATLDGEIVTERIRQITTAISVESGKRTVDVTAILGTPDAGVKSPTQRTLARMLRRVQNLEKI